MKTQTTPAILVFVLVALFLSCALCAGQDTPDVAARLRSLALAAQQAQTRHDFRAAARSYEQILRLRPDLAECWADLGLMHQFLGEYSKANSDFEVALQKNPSLYAPNLFLGLNFLMEGRTVAAIRLLKEAERLQPNDEQAAMGLARAEEALGDYAEASEWFDRATEIKPQDADAWYALGVAYLYLQNSAVVQLKRLGPASGYARSLLAESFIQEGHLNDAIRIYNALLTSSARPPFLLSALGFAYFRQGSLALARDCFKKELRKTPGCLPARLGLAQIAVVQGHFADSLEQLALVWNSDHGFFKSHLNDFVSGLSPERVTAFKSWLKQQPSDQGFIEMVADQIDSAVAESESTFVPSPSPLDNRMVNGVGSRGQTGSVTLRSRELWEEGQYTACENELKGQADLPAVSLTLLAQCACYAGDFRTTLLASESAFRAESQSRAALYWEAKSSEELSTQALARVKALTPESAKVHLLIAELYRHNEHLAQAEVEYDKALAIEPDNPAARLGLANVYDEEFRFRQAMTELRGVFRKDPGNLEASFLMGNILTGQREYARAIPYLKAALKGQPLLAPKSRSLLARCYAAQNRIADAIEELRPALPEDTDGTLHYQLYLLYRKRGDREAAVAALRQSEALRKQNLQERQELMGTIRPNP